MKVSILTILSFCGLMLALLPSEGEARGYNTNVYLGSVVRSAPVVIAERVPVIAERVPVRRYARIPCRPLAVYPEPRYEAVYVAPAPVVVRERVYPRSGFSFGFNFFN